MDPNNQNDIEKYVKGLPQGLQDFLAEGVWEERIIEIGKKYTLNEAQIDNLVDIVVLVLTGIEKPDKFLETIVKDLGISQLLATQIMNDIDNRIFDYAIKQTGLEELKQPTSPIPRTVLDTNKPKAPEIKPQNPPIKAGLPMVEKGESVKILPTPAPIKPAPQNTNIPPQPKTETVQRPVSVPRFNVSSTNNIVENKLNSVTTGVAPTNPPTKTAPVPEAPKKYAVDPYREPLQ